MVRLVSYNIHRCVGRDGVYDAGRVARVLEPLEADVVALQEVDTGVNSDGEFGPLGELSRRLDMQVVWGPTMTRRDGAYGNALLTCRPIAQVRRHDLSVPGFEPRGALDVDLGVDGRSLRVVATHLGLSGRERRVQIGRLLGMLYSQPHGRAATLMGDFNEWFRFSRNLRRLNSYLGWHARQPTFPASRPIFALDRIWVMPKAALVERGVASQAPAPAASDHLPVWANLSL